MQRSTAYASLPLLVAFFARLLLILYPLLELNFWLLILQGHLRYQIINKVTTSELSLDP
jgi:hypothetical protein